MGGVPEKRFFQHGDTQTHISATDQDLSLSNAMYYFVPHDNGTFRIVTVLGEMHLYEDPHYKLIRAHPSMRTHNLTDFAVFRLVQRRAAPPTDCLNEQLDAVVALEKIRNYKLCVR
eukprot:UN26573